MKFTVFLLGTFLAVSASGLHLRRDEQSLQASAQVEGSEFVESARRDPCAASTIIWEGVTGTSLDVIFGNCLKSIKEESASVDRTEHGTGLPSSKLMQTLTGEGVLGLVSLVNKGSHPSGFTNFKAKAEASPFGKEYDFDHPRVYAAQLFQRTSLAKFLETEDGGNTYEVRCSSESGDVAMKSLFKAKNFNKMLSTPPNGAKIVLAFGENDLLAVSDSTTDADVNMVLACVMEAAEIYHASLHFIEGTFQYLLTAGDGNGKAFNDETVLDTLLNMEQHTVANQYAAVRVLSLAKTLVWEDAVSNDLIVAHLTSVFNDCSVLNPFSGIAEADLSKFPGPIYDIYEKIMATDFGSDYDETVSLYVSEGNTVDASLENLSRLQLLVGLLHTDTFVWQQCGAVAPEFVNLMKATASGQVLTSVVFPDVATCLSGTQDTTAAYAAVVAASPDGTAKTALSDYARWLSDYRSSGLLLGWSSAFADTQCMSCTTWI